MGRSLRWGWVVWVAVAPCVRAAQSACSLDVQCRNTARHAYWHGLMDCTLPVALDLERANAKRQRVCADHALGWVQFLAPNVTIVNAGESMRSFDPNRPNECTCNATPANSQLTLLRDDSSSSARTLLRVRGQRLNTTR